MEFTVLFATFLISLLWMDFPWSLKYFLLVVYMQLKALTTGNQLGVGLKNLIPSFMLYFYVINRLKKLLNNY